MYRSSNNHTKSLFSVAMAIVMLLLHPPAPSVHAFLAPTVPSQRTAGDRLTQRFSSIAFEPPTSNLGEQVHRLLDKKKQQLQQDNRATTNTAIAPQTLPNVAHASSEAELRKLIENQQLDRLTVFKFYSNFCRACKRIAPRFDRMAKENPDVDFVFCQITPESKRYIVTDLGIPSIPYAGIAHPDAAGGLVDTMSANSQRFDSFEEVFRSHLEGERQVS